MKIFLKPNYLVVFLLICLALVLLAGLLWPITRMGVESKVRKHMEHKYGDSFVVLEYQETSSMGILVTSAHLSLMREDDYEAASKEEKEDWDNNYKIVNAYYSAKDKSRYHTKDEGARYYLHEDYDQAVRSVSGQHFGEFTSSAEILYLKGKGDYKKKDTLESLKEKSKDFQLEGEVKIFIPQSQGKSIEELNKIAKQIGTELKQQSCQNDVFIWVLKEGAYQEVKKLLGENKVQAAIDYSWKAEKTGDLQDVAYWLPDRTMED